MNKRFLLPLLIATLLLATPSLCKSQCGTVVPSSHKIDPPLMTGQTRDAIAYDLEKTLSVHVYIVASAFETYDYSAADYMPNWDVVNEIFEPIGMSFDICVETLIPNYQYNYISTDPEPDPGYRSEADMLAEFYTENVINVYYVEDIAPIGGVVPAGYAYFPGGPDVIVLTKGHGELTIEHELGHFFSLYHTFEEDLGQELVDGSNCPTTGDLICDTPADINGEILDDICQYDDLATDSNGEYYTPYLSNIMSYYGDCRCKFTNGQYNRMAWSYLTLRNYLW